MPKEAVCVLFLEVLKARLNGALCSLIWCGGNQPSAGVGDGWTLRSLPALSFCGSMIFKVPSSPTHYMFFDL